MPAAELEPLFRKLVGRRWPDRSAPAAIGRIISRFGRLGASSAARDYSSLNGPHFSSVAKRPSKSTVAPATKTDVGGSLRVYWLMITDLRSFA
jgi:hypothetical protein